MKTKSLLILFSFVFISIFFTSCEKETLQINNEEQELTDKIITASVDSEFIFSDTLQVNCIEKRGFINIVVSSNDSASLSHFLNAYSLSIKPFAKDTHTFSRNNLSNNNEEIYINDYLLNDLVEVSIEVIGFSKEYESNDLIISFCVNDYFLKSNPPVPNKYYIGYKAKIKRKYLGLKYFPVDNDPSGFIYKWGYTNCWLCKWHWDTYWNWLQGYINFEWPMQHPLSNKGYYRLGVQLYTNTYSNFEIRESDNPINW